MTIRPTLRTNYKRSDGTHSIRIRISEGNNPHVYVPINIHVKKSEWNEKDCRVKNRVNAQEINSLLSNIENLAEVEILNGNSHRMREIIENFINPPAPVLPEVTYSPVSFWHRYIERMREGKILHRKTKQPLAAGYITGYSVCLKRLEGFIRDKKKGHFEWSDISEQFYDEFVSYLRNEWERGEDSPEGMKENSIGLTIKRMLTVFKRAKKEGLLDIYDFDGFVVITQETESIALTPDEIEKIRTADLYGMHILERERERFLIAYNFLLRFGDSISITEKNIYREGGKNYLRMTSQKTKESVMIPIMPVVYEILKKNKFRVPEISNQKSNQYLKDLGKECGIDTEYTITEHVKGKKIETVYKRWELITTHTTRRSAATNLYLSGMDLESIRMFGGWKTIKQLMDYIKIDKIENAKNQADHPFFGMK